MTLDVLGRLPGGSIRAIIHGSQVDVPDDYENSDRQLIAEWEALGNTIPPYVPPAPTVDAYEDAIQALVDATAREKLFRDGVTLASYTASTNLQWAAEAAVFVAWRDGVWDYAYAELAKVQAGQREQPSIEDFLTEIGPIDWP